MEMSRRRLLGVGAITTALAVGQGVRPSRSVAQGQQINLYSSRHYNTDNELYEGFTRRTGIRVNLIEGKADALIERIKAEGRNSPADVFLTVDAGRLWKARYAKSDDPAKQSVFKTIKVFFPNQGDRGTHVNISGGGLVKTAPNADGARQFLEYLASSSAQVFFAQGNDEYPVVAGTALDPIVGDFGTFKEDQTVHVGTYGENQAEAVRLMDRAGWV